jgi:hypothetical protein
VTSPFGSPEIVALLRSHGVRGLTARTVAQEGASLRQRMGAIDVEYAALFDEATGQQVGDVLIGETDEVYLRAHIVAMQPGRRYVHLHTHPASSAFSLNDLAVLLAHPPLRTMTVVGRNGSWYFLSKLRGQPTASPEDGIAAWLTVFRTLDPHYDALIAAGVVTQDEALQQQLHETMVSVAPQLRLRYDRLERT